MVEQKTFKKMTDGKIVLEDVIYDTSVSKKAIILNPQTGNRIDSIRICLLYTSPSPRDRQKSRMPSSA